MSDRRKPALKAPRRRRAAPARAVAAKAGGALAAKAGGSVDRDRLLQELEVHQVELELQNEELRTARQGVEVALERYTEVFDFAPFGYAVLAADGTIQEINHAAARVLGLDRARLIGRRWAMFVGEASRTAFDALVHMAFEQGLPARGELELLRDIDLVPVRATVGPLRRSERSAMLAFEDISESRIKAGQLERSEQALRESNRRKDEFLAMLSHELRNPLAPIRTCVSVLQMAPAGSPEAANALAIIDRSTAHLTRLVDDLLDVTRIASGKVTLQRERVELCELVRQTIAEHAYACADRLLTVTSAFEVDAAWVDGDRARLVQVISNVLGNAEKFTPAHGHIHVAVSVVADVVIVRVIDTGIGIAPAMLGLVFEAFAQAPQDLDRPFGGLGLGLTMVKALVELHGGRAAIRSAGADRGVEVSVALPLAAAARRSQDRPVVTSRGPCKVLVIEDKPDTAEALRYALQLKGHSVAVAYDGHSALALAPTFAPDVVLCDLGLPDMDGYAVARELRRIDALHGVCMVALSGYARAEDVARALEAGFDRHIAKPPRLEEIDQLLATVARH